MVFVPSILPPTPCTILPNLFAPALFQIFLCFGSHSECQYFNNLHVCWSRTGLADSLLHQATWSAIDSAGDFTMACLRLFTQSSIDSNATILELRIDLGAVCFGFGDATISRGCSPLLNGCSSLAARSNTTLRGGTVCTTLGGWMVSGTCSGWTHLCFTLGLHSAACSIGYSFPGLSAAAILWLPQSVCHLLCLCFIWLHLEGLGLLWWLDLLLKLLAACCIYDWNIQCLRFVWLW